MKVALKCWIGLFAFMQLGMLFDNNHGSSSLSNPYLANNLNNAFEQVSISHQVAHAAPGLKLLWVLGCVAGIGVTILWLKFATTRTRQSGLAKTISVLLLIAGTYLCGAVMPLMVIAHFAEIPWQVQQMLPSLKTPPSLLSAFGYFALGSVLLVASYLAGFSRNAHRSARAVV